MQDEAFLRLVWSNSMDGSKMQLSDTHRLKNGKSYSSSTQFPTRLISEILRFLSNRRPTHRAKPYRLSQQYAVRLRSSVILGE